MRRHGLSKEPEYLVWCAMMRRCYNKNVVSYKYYGGRGISVCKRWHKFDIFLQDMGKRPDNTYQIDRIDNNENYKPENCRWIKSKENNNNRRSNRFYTYNNETKTMSEWAKYFNIDYALFMLRLRRGIPFYEAATNPKRPQSGWKASEETKRKSSESHLGKKYVNKAKEIFG